MRKIQWRLGVVKAYCKTNHCLFIYGVLLVAVMSLKINPLQEAEQGELQLKEGDFSIAR